MDATGHADSTNGFLAQLPQEAMRVVSAASVEIDLTPSVQLHRAGECIQHIYFPFGGLVSAVASMTSGDDIQLACFGCESAIGLAAALGAEIATSSAVVQIGGRARRIETADFRRMIADSAALIDLVTRHNQAYLIQVQQTAACNALHEIERRICRWLLQVHDRVGDHIRITQEDLSLMLGVQRSTVTSVAKRLQASGIIKTGWGHVHVSDRGGLEARSCECYGLIRRQMELVLPR
jgi:CRP-like cAMP-binding protein